FCIFLLFKSQLCLSQHIPYFPQLNNSRDLKGKFPLQYQIKEIFPSDIILLKCPGPTYNHNNKEDTFKVNGTYDKDIVKGLLDESVIRWIKVFNSEKKLEKKITCGELILKENPLELIKWEINLKWNSLPNPLKTMKNYFVNSPLGASTRDCPSDGRLQFVKKKNGTVIQYENEETAIYHKGDLIYLFEKPKKLMIKVAPCQIFNAIQIIPTINIKTPSNMIKNLNHINILKIGKDIRRETFEVELIIKKEHSKHQQFYEYENVQITNLKFYSDGSIKKHSTPMISNKTITIKGYQLLRFEYICDECYVYVDQNYHITKDIFFGSTEKDYVETFSDIFNNKNKTFITPNCSLDQYTFGFLYKMVFANLEITVNDFLMKNMYKNNTFILSNSTIFFKNETYNGILQCIYSTPDNGTFTTKTVFKTIEDSSFNVTYQKKNTIQKRLSNSFLALIMGISALSICIFLCIIIILSRKHINEYIKLMILKKKYPNIQKFWLNTQKIKMSEYSNIVKEINNEVVNDELRGVKSIIIGEEFVNTFNESDYNDTLVNSQKKLVNKISAHYITSVSPSRTYILSEAPSSNNVSQFWEMIFEEKVQVIVAFVYNVVMNASEPFEIYWPTKKSTTYGKLTVINEGETDSFIKNVTTINFKIIKEGRNDIILRLFYVNDWKENTIPDNINNLAGLYEEVDKIAGNNPVLIHSSSINGPRTFLFVFFAGIVESLINDKIFYEPMKVIKKIKKQKHCSYISSIEYAYLIFSVVEYLANNKYILMNGLYFKYFEMFVNYAYNTMGKMKINDKYLNLFKFFISLDTNYINRLVDLSDKEGILTSEEIKIKCQRSTLLNEYEKQLPPPSRRMHGRRNHFPGQNCLDNNAINFNISTNIRNPFDKMSMANEMTFINSENMEKKFIMMPSPLEEMYDGFIELVYQNNVSVILVLDNYSEIYPKNWETYWPFDKYDYKYGDYIIKNIEKVTKLGNGFEVSYYDIIHSTDKNKPKVCFKLVHYVDWESDKYMPMNNIAFTGMRRYAVMESSKERPMIIHCKNGIDRTDTVAYVLYMMEKLSNQDEFDPIRDLKFLRQHRLNAVQNKQQFLTSLSALLHFNIPALKIYDKNIFNELKKILMEGVKLENIKNKKKR
ncbi:Protein-tyrosine phosphatase,receptor/non-receptor type domain and Protein-tyrosine/Dual specificity phosphatase domain and Protein-tyrosine phosphatase, catalytic domain-containing protein, partial [Strongyloides ratti]